MHDEDMVVHALMATSEFYYHQRAPLLMRMLTLLVPNKQDKKQEKQIKYWCHFSISLSSSLPLHPTIDKTEEMCI